MDESKYFKATCAHCGNHIEFPDSALGRMVECPHCGQKTQLRVVKIQPTPPPETASPPNDDDDDNADEEQTSEPTTRGMPPTLIAIVAGVLILGGAGAIYFQQHSSKPAAPAPAPPPATAKTKTQPKESKTNPPPQIVAVTPTPTNQPEQTAPPAPATPTRAKSPDDLKVGKIQLEKANGSSLVYAVGQLTNDSDYQRFGVKVQLDMLNKAGDKIGTTQDYIAILEPRKKWSFRALVTDSKAVAAKLSAIKEDE